MMKTLGSLIAATVVMLALSECHNASKQTATPPAQPQSSLITRNANGTIVERIKLREPILTQQGVIDLVVRIRNVPEAPHIVFYVPCYATGDCQAQPIPGEPRLVVLEDGGVIAISNTTPDTTHWKRWTPPASGGI